jgi:hypothetical protein
MQDLLFQYLQLRLGFNTKDQAHMLVVMAVSSLTIKVNLMRDLEDCCCMGL